MRIDITSPDSLTKQMKVAAEKTVYKGKIPQDNIEIAWKLDT